MTPEDRPKQTESAPDQARSSRSRARAIPAPTSAALAAARLAEEAIRSVDREIVVAFNLAGREILRKTGMADHVDLEPAEVRLLRDAVITHNHLTGFVDTFWVADVRVAALARASEVRVVTPTTTLVLRPPQSGWSHDWAERTFVPAWERERRQLISEMRGRIRRGEASHDEANRILHHECWNRVAWRLGMQYGRDEERTQ